MKNEEMKENKEYSIYCIYGKGSPFQLNVYKTFMEAKNKLNEIVQYEEERHRIYYVDNDFFDNKYPLGVQDKYFSIIERTVSEWKKYSEEKNHIKEIPNEKTRNKIIAFTKYR